MTAAPPRVRSLAIEFNTVDNGEIEFFLRETIFAVFLQSNFILNGLPANFAPLTSSLPLVPPLPPPRDIVQVCLHAAHSDS